MAAWIGRMRHHESDVRDQAAYDIELIHPSGETINDLIAALSDPSARIRRYVIFALGEMASTSSGEPYRGKIARSVEPSLTHYDHRVRAQASTAIAKCGAVAGPILAAKLTDTRIIDRPGYAGLYLDDQEGEMGVRVRGTVDQSPSFQAGLQRGDIVLRFGRQELWSKPQLVSLVTFARPADHVELTVLRDGQTIHRVLRIGHRAAKSKDEDWRDQATRVCEQVTATLSRLPVECFDLTSEVLQHRDPLVRRCGLFLANRRSNSLLTIRRALYDRDELVRMVARECVRGRGPDAIAAVLDLLNAANRYSESSDTNWIENDDVRSIVSAFGKEVLPILRQAQQRKIGDAMLVSSLIEDVESGAMNDLVPFGMGDVAIDGSAEYGRSDAVPEWSVIVQQLQSSSRLERMNALPWAPSMVSKDSLAPYLVHCLSDDLPALRFAAANCAIRSELGQGEHERQIRKALLDGRIEQDARADLIDLQDWLNPWGTMEFAACCESSASDEQRVSDQKIVPVYPTGSDDGPRSDDIDDGVESFWPPPRKMAVWDTLRVREVHPRAKDLRDVHQWLVSDVSASGFEGCSIFTAPNGFALLTPLERVHSDGARKGNSYKDSDGSQDRWTRQKLPAKSLWSYFNHLLYAKPGTHRLFAFVVTDRDKLENRDRESREAQSLVDSIYGDMKILPDDIGDIEVDGHFIHVLVYQFERRMGGRLEVCESANPTPCNVHLSVFEHLRRANLHAFAYNLDKKRSGGSRR
ncbi:MAG: PDZ domain-containing protein [Planctomycetota bacterium]